MPVRFGMIYTTVPGRRPWNITFSQFTSGPPPPSVFDPPQDFPSCTEFRAVRLDTADNSFLHLASFRRTLSLSPQPPLLSPLSPSPPQQQRQQQQQQQQQPYFPVFHIRPPAGHVNDPNGPFRDPATGYVHLFMQYCPLGPCMGQSAPITPGETPNYQSATHFYSTNLVTWRWTGDSGGVIAGGKNESSTDCPDDHGVYSGSTTIVNGTPTYVYPGVHLNPHAWSDGKHYPTMSQCIATPADSADPSLHTWKKRTIIPSAQIPRGLRQHFHDDSEAFVGQDGRWWLFVGTASCPGTQKPTGDCPYPDPTVTSTYGVNFLFSSADFHTWRAEHSLYNSTSSFVSCPE